MTEMTITKEDIDGRHGRYVGRIDGNPGVAQIVFTHRGPGLVSADHTEADDSMRGTGAAAALVRHMVEDARSEGFRIVPLCSYVAAQSQRHPEWQDVFAGRDAL